MGKDYDDQGTKRKDEDMPRNLIGILLVIILIIIIVQLLD